MTEPARTSGKWYLLVLIPIAIAGVAGYLAFSGMVDQIEKMKRVVMPGEHQLELAAGEHVVYGETTSTVDGTAYHTTSISLSCNLVEVASGEPVRLETPTGSTTYSLGGYAGQSMFQFELARGGAYLFTCTSGENDPAVLAIGPGIGAGIVLAVLSIVLPLIAAIVIAVVIRRKRRRSRPVA